MYVIRRRLRAALLAVSVLPLATTSMSAAHAADLGGATLAGASGAGIHNTYDDKSTYTYLANALDTGTSLVELDTWANALNGKWDVSHSNPVGSDNTCVKASTAADL